MRRCCSTTRTPAPPPPPPARARCNRSRSETHTVRGAVRPDALGDNVPHAEARHVHAKLHPHHPRRSPASMHGRDVHDSADLSKTTSSCVADRPVGAQARPTSAPVTPYRAGKLSVACTTHHTSSALISTADQRVRVGAGGGMQQGERHGIEAAIKQLHDPGAPDAISNASSARHVVARCTGEHATVAVPAQEG